MATYSNVEGFISKHPATFTAQGHWYFYVTCFQLFFDFLSSRPPPHFVLVVWYGLVNVPGLFSSKQYRHNVFGIVWSMCRDCLELNSPGTLGTFGNQPSFVKFIM